MGGLWMSAAFESLHTTALVTWISIKKVKSLPIAQSAVSTSDYSYIEQNTVGIHLPIILTYLFCSLIL